MSDTGEGVPAHLLDRIFEPFFTTKEVGRGTGLGLASSLRIVEEHEGTMSVESEVGSGTTFFIHLPRCPEDAGETPPEEPFAGESIVDGHGKILLVEDDPSLIRAAGRVLDVAGYEVREAATPGEAMRIVEAEGAELDLLLCDLGLPEMAGTELVDEIRRRLPGLPVLFISGYSERDLEAREVDREGAPFLQKPFEPFELTRRVREVLDGEG